MFTSLHGSPPFTPPCDKVILIFQHLMEDNFVKALTNPYTLIARLDKAKILSRV
jgi:hypothetical protein